MSTISLILLVLYIALSQCYITIKENDLQQCVFNSEIFWNVYRKHFEITNSITIRIIDSSSTHLYIDRVLGEFYKSTKLNSSVIVKRLIHLTGTDRKASFPQEIPSIDLHPRIDLEATLDDEALFKIKKVTSDLQNGNIIIAWNERSILDYLKRDKDHLIGNSRSLYLILFLSRKGDDFGNVDEIGATLFELWRKYRILNALIQHACVRDSHVFIFNPFYRDPGGKWGLVRRFSLEEVDRQQCLIYNTLKNLNDYQLNVSIFSRLPTVTSTIPKNMKWNPLYQNLNKSGGYSGQDAMLLGNMAAYMNFSVRIFSNRGGENFGKTLDNGSITGALGDVAYGRADIAANARFVDHPESGEYEYTMAFSSDRICIVVPKAEEIPKWITIFNCFSIISWTAILMSILLYMGVLYFMRILQNNYIYHVGNLHNLMMVFAIFLSTSVKIPRLGEQRLLIATWLIFSMVISSTFQGSLFRAFSTVTYHRDIDTFEELDASTLPIATSLDIFINGTTELVKRLHKRQIYMHGNSLKVTARYRNICAVERQNDARLFLSTIHVTKDGTPLLHLMKECIVSYFVAQVLPFGSPYLHKFNNVIMAFIESGLISKWYQDMVNGLITQRQSEFRGEGNEIVNPLDIAVFTSAFLMLLVGIGISCIAFCLEVFAGKNLQPFRN